MPTATIVPVVGLLLSVTFACGLVVAVAHVVNRRFVAPAYDVVANLLAFCCAVAASTLLHHWVPAGLAAVAVGCWVVLAVRTTGAIRSGRPRHGQTEPPAADQMSNAARTWSSVRP
ncbi:hypothetical protein [Nocardioides stalactiti]|uniref:hypothetical protein n=1 Tax=Nocardioides stalactiti TaxID=2755356 RepID=UPI001C7F0E66|nr:hypothetical protein [Nocardioides stalactiti]